jgi:hypothetical protein
MDISFSQKNNKETSEVKYILGLLILISQTWLGWEAFRRLEKHTTWYVCDSCSKRIN